ncbi:MAG TPA: S1-like domain-containing RNA-binding protein [Prolixibacteraceae bacterium]|nr:S1-like domain-containing RNA-binding protein [Prolixibacteraceae bacterium]
MVRIGKKSVLEVVKFTEQGAYLDGGPYGEILLPRRYVSDSLSEEDEIEVFISFDSEDRLVATTVFPAIMVDEFGALEVVDVNRFGAFLDWGLPKDLFVPFAEQAVRMEKGQKYVVRAFVDPKSGRILASSKLNKFLSKEESSLQIGDEVDLLITAATDLGFKAIINNRFSGLLFHNELFKPIEIGDKMPGYVKNIRPDGKIDLSLDKQGYQRIDPVADSILEKIKQSGGVLNLSDKSDPDTIKQELGISKKAFKQAIGALYKKELIVIEPENIRLA